MPRVETTLSPPNDYLVDMIETLSITTISQLLIRHGGWMQGQAAAGNAQVRETILGQSNVGTVTVVGTQPFLDGQIWYSVLAAAAVNGRQGPPLFPGLGYPFTGNPTESLQPLRYRWRGLLQRSALPVGSWFGAGFRRTNASLLRSATGQGFAVESEAGTFGGNWTICYRVNNASALVTEDTGIPGTDRLFFDFTFDDTTAQEMLVTLNGQAFGPYTAAGGQLPVQAAGDTNLFAGIFQESTGALGNVDRWRQMRYTVYRLNGFPD